MSLSNDKNFMKQLDTDIDRLSKLLYLDNPDLWMEFIGKSNDRNFDEMSLFFAVKNDIISILRYAVEENNFDLNLPSKDRNFESIKENLLDVAIKENSKLTLDYLSTLESNNPSNTISSSDLEYICPNCKSNIFQSGYNVLISSTCTYSNLSKKIVRSTPKELDVVICSNCNFKIEEVTPSKLEHLTNVENCYNCGSCLTNNGVVKEVSINYNKDTNTFSDGDKSYCCKSCRNSLAINQLEYFNLI